MSGHEHPHRRDSDLDTSDQSQIAVQLAALAGEVRGAIQLANHRVATVERELRDVKLDVRAVSDAQQRRLGRDAGIALAAATVSTVLALIVSAVGGFQGRADAAPAPAPSVVRVE